jgi:hypothetical protein
VHSSCPRRPKNFSGRLAALVLNLAADGRDHVHRRTHDAQYAPKLRQRSLYPSAAILCKDALDAFVS